MCLVDLKGWTLFTGYIRQVQPYLHYLYFTTNVQRVYITCLSCVSMACHVCIMCMSCVSMACHACIVYHVCILCIYYTSDSKFFCSAYPLFFLFLLPTNTRTKPVTPAGIITKLHLMPCNGILSVIGVVVFPSC